MKKLLGFLMMLTLLLVAHPVSAQLEFGIKGGLNISKVHFKGKFKDKFSADNLNGFYLGPTLEALIPGVGLGVETSLFYTQKGFETYVGEKKYKVKSDYLELPVSLKWKFGMPALKVFLGAGPYASVRLGGSNSIKEQIRTKTFGAGVNFSAGFELIKHLQIGFNYGLGLTDNYSHKNEAATGQDRGWSANATILF